MSEMGGLDIGMPDEGQGGLSEAAREAAQQRFAGTQQALQQLQREEKKSRKRDDSVAQVILQFLTDTQKTHLATLISRLVSLNCPSTFILAVLSLINEQCRAITEEYLKEKEIDASIATVDSSMVPANSALSEESNAQLGAWMVRCELTMRADEDHVLDALVVDDQNIDGTVLQLTAFVLQEFLAAHKKEIPFEHLQQLAVAILQPIFQPAMHARMSRRIEASEEENI